MTDLLPTLQEFYRDKLTAVLRHQAAALLVAQYDANNAYQYLINREDTQLGWVAQAIVRHGGEVPEDQSEPARPVTGKGIDAAAPLLEEDARDAQAFVDRWTPRVQALVNARERGMLEVILGETLEHKRFFEQARAGRTDLLGRRTASVGALVGQVLPTRWLE